MKKKFHFLHENDVRMLIGGPAIAATRSDTADDPNGPARALLLDGSGSVKFACEGQDDSEAVTLDNLAVGVMHPFPVRRVWSTGTTVASGKVYLVI